jgi:hypothetical protein
MSQYIPELLLSKETLNTYSVSSVVTTYSINLVVFSHEPKNLFKSPSSSSTHYIACKYLSNLVCTYDEHKLHQFKIKVLSVKKREFQHVTL